MSYFGARNRITRLMLEKIENDKFLNQIDRNEFYTLNELDQLGQLKEKFIQCNEDEETTNFIELCYEKSEWFITQLYHSILFSLLKFFMASTSINGLLQRGSMFVFSVQQFRMLIDFDTIYGGRKLNNILDLGAGDGEVTSKMAPFFENIYTTEMSIPMQWRLKQKGFKVVSADSWYKLSLDSFGAIKESSNLDVESNSNRFLKFDAVSCLNLLDRCEKPLTTLKNIKNSLVDNGILIVALVLPFKPYVEYNNDKRPTESLFNFTLIESKLIDEQIQSSNGYCEKQKNNCKKMNKVNSQIKYLIENVFEPIGFDLVKFTRLPYLCEGNLAQSYYYMFDYIFIFRSK